MFYLTENKDKIEDYIFFGKKDLILAATTIIPLGTNRCDHNSNNLSSTLGAKIRALIQIYKYLQNIIANDNDIIEHIFRLLKVHLLHNESLYERTLHDSFQQLEISLSDTSPRIHEPAMSYILSTIYGILKLLLRDSNYVFKNGICPTSFIASLIPLLMSPIREERIHLLDIFNFSILNLGESCQLEIMHALGNYLDMISMRELPLRGVNSILQLAVTYLNTNVRNNELVSKAFLNFVHSCVFTLYKNRFFYLISESYGYLIKMALEIFYRNPSKPSMKGNSLESFSVDSDSFIEHPFVENCRTKIFLNFPKLNNDNQIAFVALIDRLLSIQGLITVHQLPLVLISLKKHMSYTTEPSIVEMYVGIIQEETFENLSDELLRRVLQIVWTTNLILSPKLENSYT